MEFETTTWSFIAHLLEQKTSILIDWEKRKFVCPYCKQDISEEIFYYMPIEVCKETKVYSYCPICYKNFVNIYD